MELEAIIARALQILLALGGAYLIALWFVLVVWTFRDIESRSRNVLTQIASTLLVVFFYVPGFLLYWLLRPKETLDEAYQRSLEEEYLLQDLQELPLCPTCHHYVEDDYQICPHCNSQLKEACHSCGRLVDLQWSVCPYCAAPQHRHDHGTDEVHEEVVEEEWIDPDEIIRRLRSGRTQELPARTAAGQQTEIIRPRTDERVKVTTASDRKRERETSGDRSS
ncbi:MAG TPA: zinc ribbon domain-containing protein [Thermomicrobiales bacterium]|nr:zinc ribbon domain-containing protein [Thermomicrobiales bacterium]